MQVVSNIQFLYGQLRDAIDSGSDSMSHDDALQQIEQWKITGQPVQSEIPQMCQEHVCNSSNMVIGGKYNWIGQIERLIYVGKEGYWHQFKKIGDPRYVWCEVPGSDLSRFEQTSTPAPDLMIGSISEDTSPIAPTSFGSDAPLANLSELNKKLLNIIACAYQIAGTYDIPAHILDVLSNPIMSTQDEIDAMLPYAPSQAVIPQLNWSEERKPSSTIRYNHVISNCALGPISIEWKGWKEYDSYVTYVDGQYLNTDSTLEAAKARVGIHLHMIAQSLSQGLDN